MAISLTVRLCVGVTEVVRVWVQVKYRVSVGVNVDWNEGDAEPQTVFVRRGLELPETDTVVVFELLVLAVSVRVPKSVFVAKIVLE